MIKTLHIFKAAVVLLPALFTTSGAFAAELLYGNEADRSVLKGVDTGTNAASTFAIASGQSISGLAANDAASRLYVSFGTAGTTAVPSNNIFTYDYNGNLVTSSRTANSGGNGFGFEGLAFANGTLYGVHANSTNATGGVYTINPSTGATTIVGALIQGGTNSFNFRDFDYDSVNRRFIGVTANGNGITSGIYSFTLPVVGTDYISATRLADLPTDAPADSSSPPGKTTPDGLAYDSGTGIAYLTYNRSTTVSRYSVATNTYLTSAAGPAQTQGAAGDATFATGFIGYTPEPAELTLLVTGGVLLRRHRRRSTL